MSKDPVMTASPNIARLGDMLRTAEGQKTCIEWLSSDFTQLMLAAGREMCRAKPPRVIEPHLVSYEMGELVGGTKMVDFFTNPKSAPSVRGETVKQPQPTYGARGILEQERT